MKSNPSIWGAKIRELPALHLVFLLCHIAQEILVLISSPTWQPGSSHNEGSLQKQPSWPQFLNCLHTMQETFELQVALVASLREPAGIRSDTQREETEKGTCQAGQGKAQQVWELIVQGAVRNWKMLTAQKSLFGLKTIFFCSPFIIIWAWCD